MKITAAKVFVCCPGRNFVTLKIHTDEGMFGLELQEGYRIVRQHTTTPLAIGEVFSTIWDARILITEQLIDYIRMTTVHAGASHI